MSHRTQQRRTEQTAEEALLRASGTAGIVSLLSTALFGTGSAGDVVVSVNDPNFGGIRSIYRSLTILPGVTVTLADPFHALVLRVQSKITIGGTIDGSAQVGPLNIGDLLVGAQFGGGSGGSGGGGGSVGNGQNGNRGQNGQNFGGPELGAAFPLSFGQPGNQGNGGVGGVGGDGQDGTPTITNGYDLLFVEQFGNPYGWPNLVLGGVAGSNGGAGVPGGLGGASGGPGGASGTAGAAGVGGSGGGKIYLICPEIEILATASLLTNGGNGTAGTNGGDGGDAAGASGDGGGGGGSGGEGGGGGTGGPIIFVTQKLTIHPGATINSLGGVGALGGLGGAGGAGDGGGFAGGNGGDGSDGQAGFDWPGGFSLIQL